MGDGVGVWIGSRYRVVWDVCVYEWIVYWSVRMYDAGSREGVSAGEVTIEMFVPGGRGGHRWHLYRRLSNKGCVWDQERGGGEAERGDKKERGTRGVWE